MPYPDDETRDPPWVMRTYAGHSSPGESNALYRRNLAKGQTGLSIAFDLPTQTGYDPDADLARGEVGKVGVPVTHIGDLRSAVRRHPARPDEHLHDDQRPGDVAAGAVSRGRRGAGRRLRQARRHHAERHHQGVPVPGHVRLPARAVAAADHRHDRVHGGDVPKWNPINVCSYHLQEAGATPVQEVAFALCTAIAVLDSVRDSGQVPRGASSVTSSRASRSSSTPACASSRRCASCARSAGCGTRSPATATA